MAPEAQEDHLVSYRLGQIEAHLKNLTDVTGAFKVRLEEIHTSFEVFKMAVESSPDPGASQACVHHIESVRQIGRRVDLLEERVVQALEKQDKMLESIRQKIWVGMGIILGVNALVFYIFQ